MEMTDSKPHQLILLLLIWLRLRLALDQTYYVLRKGAASSWQIWVFYQISKAVYFLAYSYYLHF